MNYDRFLQQLPAYYDDWAQSSVRPKSQRFQQVLDQVKGMTTGSVLQLLNLAVAGLEPGEVYCEIGCYQGSTLIGALLGNEPKVALAADNFSQFDPEGVNRTALMRNLKAFGVEERATFYDQSFEEFFLKLRRTGTRIGVYFYDGSHDYRSQLLGLLLAEPFLADQALIIVDDANWRPVKQANWDFIATRPQAQMRLEVQTPGNCHPTFWNGIHVLSWDRQAPKEYDWATFQRVREPLVIDSIYYLQYVNIKIEGSQVHVTQA